MERQPIFRDRFEVTEDDLENLTKWTQESSDHIVGDAIEAGRRYVGFGVTGDTTTSVVVSNGRIYVGGPRYFDDTVGGFPLDLSGQGLKPDLLKRIVSIVVSPDPRETAIEERDYETDAEAGTKEPRQVKVERRRGVRIEAVGGDESVAPQAPVINSQSAVIVAFVLMGTGGIEKITPNVLARLDNLSDVAKRTGSLEGFRSVAEPAISGVQAALAALGAANLGQADRKLIYDLVSNVAILNQRQGLPQVYTGYEADAFTDESLSNTGAIGYAARIEEGLRLPYAAVNETQLGLANIYDPKVKVTGGGLLLPAYIPQEDRVVRGASGEIGLASYEFAPRTYTKLDFARQRIRYGADYEVSTASAFYLSGTYIGRVNGGVRATFVNGNETFQVYETGKVDADGHRIVRLSKYWYDVTNEPYWSRTSTPSIITGYAHCETFLNKNDRWVVGMTPWIHGKPASGQLQFGICGTYRGEPDFDQVISMTTLESKDVILANNAGPDQLMTPVEPFFLKGGTFYTYFVNTSQNFIHAVADEQNPHSGTYFYGLNGGHWFADPGLHLIFSLYSAYFGTTYVETEMQGLTLAGGIQGVDVLAGGVTPSGTDVVIKLYVGNEWRTIDELDTNVLTSLPPFTRMAIGFAGTPDCMPGVMLTGSRVRATRLAKAGRHISKAKVFPSPVNRDTEVLLLSSFDAAHNTITIKADPGTGLVSHSTLVDEVQIDGAIKRTVTFNFAAPTTSVVTQIDVTTDSEFRAPVVTNRTRVGTA